MRYLSSTFVRYFVVGLSTFILDYGLLFVLSKLGMKESLANVFSVLIAAIYSFFMHNYWSFSAGNNYKLKKSLRYIVVTIINYLLNIFIFYTLYDILEIERIIFNIFSIQGDLVPSGLLTKMLITGLMMCWNYFIFKYWVFRKESKTEIHY
jgi:putative flippase GtrA